MGASQSKFSPTFYLLNPRIGCDSTSWEEALVRIYIQSNQAFDHFVSGVLSPMRSLTLATSLGQLTSAMVFAFK